MSTETAAYKVSVSALGPAKRGQLHRSVVSSDMHGVVLNLVAVEQTLSFPDRSELCFIKIKPGKDHPVDLNFETRTEYYSNDWSQEDGHLFIRSHSDTSELSTEPGPKSLVFNIQSFFGFNGPPNLQQILNNLDAIHSKHYADRMLKFMVTYKGYNRLEEFQNLQDAKQAILEPPRPVQYLQCTIRGRLNTYVNLMVELANDIVGPNGNYTLMSEDEAKIQDVEAELRANAGLTKHPAKDFLPNTNAEEAMLVKPIFRGRQFSLTPRSCFILMPFGEEWSDRTWRLLTEIVTASGLKPVRADDLYGSDVVEDIWQGINEAEVVIADLTGKNTNVFYEVGLAHTIGKPTILLTQNIKHVPFDLRSKRLLFYQDNTDGKEAITKELPKYLSQLIP